MENSFHHKTRIKKMKVNECKYVAGDYNAHVEKLTEAYKNALLTLGDFDVNNLSVFQLQLLKLVASSSITTLRAKGKTNLEILKTQRHHVDPQKKQKQAEKLINSLTDEQLTALGLSRI